MHTWRGRGCSIFIEINVKRQSSPRPLQVCSILQCTAHIQPSKFISNIILKSVHHFGTTAGVIRVFIYRRFWRSHLRKSLKNSSPPPPPSEDEINQSVNEVKNQTAAFPYLVTIGYQKFLEMDWLQAFVLACGPHCTHTVQYTGSFYERSTLSLLIGRSGRNKTKFLTPIQCLSPALKGLPLESC